MILLHLRYSNQMALPSLTEYGLLPDGIHDCSMADVETLFASTGSSQRCRELFGRLGEFLQELRLAGWASEVIIDGSFVMSVVGQSNDLDLVLVLPKDWDLRAEVRPFEYDLISSRRARRRFGFDVFAVPSASVAERNWITFFSGVGRKWVHELSLSPGTRKGLLRVRP